MRSLGRVSTHEAMHAIGAITVNITDIDTLYEPDSLDVSGLAAAEAASTKNILKSRLSARRYDEEIGGIRRNALPVHTLRESQTKIAATKYAFDQGIITSVNWKFADGTFRTLNAAEFTSLYLAVIAHVKACYDVEMAKLAEIDATGTTDLETGWPT